MPGLREAMERRPWIGWMVAGLLVVLGVVLWWKPWKEPDPYTIERMGEMVTIRCRETGAEWEVQRGLMERELRRRSGVIDPDVGLTNPETGRPTGFPRSQWEATIDRINAEKADVQSRRQTSAPRSGGNGVIGEGGGGA